MNKEVFSIFGFPKYHLEVDSNGFKIISFHYSKTGKERKLGYDPDTGYSGYQLFNDGHKKFYTLADLKQIANVERAKAAVKKGKKVKTSVGGVIQNGDWIVGSIMKIGGAVSMSSFPARHPTKESAKQEAARLAGVNKNKKFVVLKVDAIASVQDVNWE